MLGPLTPTTRLGRESLEEFVARSRVAQGLPPKITDPEVLALIAAGIIDHRARMARLNRRAA